MKNLLYCIFGLVLHAHAQFAPPPGQTGSTAIYKDSSCFKLWATGCNVVRGLRDISLPDSGYASVGDNSMATGMAGVNGVVSLGDGGSAILTFAFPIINGPGFDFAVFENAFSDIFLELAFVEVSSDGFNFFRFPATSLTDTLNQTGTTYLLDATKINNLAGKYRAMYGTPFDLEELKNEAGLDVNNITQIKIIDVVGSLDNAYARYDSYDNKINDPWPTPFASGGFDLDAVGVINSTYTTVLIEDSKKINIFPNPVKRGASLHISVPENEIRLIELFDITGKQIQIENEFYGIKINELMEAGIYFLKITGNSEITIKKIIVE